MKKGYHWLFSLLVFFLSMTAYGAQSPLMTEPTKSIVVQPNQKTIVLRLRSNPTTGYSWYFESTKPAWLRVVSRQFVAPKTQLVGAPGYEEWTFGVPKLSGSIPRIASIVMRYARPWDIKGSKPTTFYVVFTAK